MKDVAALLREVDALLDERLIWQHRSENLAGQNCEVFQTSCSNWRLLLVVYPAGEEDGHRAGVAGTATNVTKITVIRLTPELAKKALNLARRTT